ncbi:glycosyltransferase family 39 protein [Qipengyuania xiapuensis]|uniref:Glycosyltransferase family 39 protein n=1 Tax=Qipengyuania xiapuensis TaxID=2867236 RepID=A0ABX8ZVQ1_9SPHN|nr:glycosyltransferase family 39 protein [Qipengyuania xiapuensis]QZD93070.1 glycosyltransferase family 39 protein [Qipengyuania xiapuensis]
MHTPRDDAAPTMDAALQGQPFWRALGVGALAIAVLGLIGRLLSYPLNRDENMFVSVAQMLGSGDLYRDLGYNHLPNLPYLLGGIFAVTGSSGYLLTARLLVAAFWLLALFFLWRISRNEAAGLPAFLAAASVLVGSTLLLGEPGMLATNNLIPVALVFPAVFLLFRGLDEERPSAGYLLGAGLVASLAIGFKANYTFLAAFFVLAVLIAPKGATVGQKLLYGLLPLGIGGLLGGLPSLVHMLSDPDAFFAHTLRYFTELQTAYWAESEAPKTVSLKGKILLAQSIWFANTSLIALMLVVTQMALIASTDGLRALFDWKVTILGLAVISGLVVAFVPTPSFAQYFVPPLPFLVLLIPVLAGRLSGGARQFAGMLLAAGAALALVNAVPRLGAGLAAFASPSAWGTIADGRAIARAGSEAGLRPGDRVAALTPVWALDAGYSIYPEFAAGQFVYRVAPYIPPQDRPFYRTTSPASLTSFLDADPPAAVLVNRAEPMEADLAAYALSRGYRPAGPSGEDRPFDLYVAPR